MRFIITGGGTGGHVYPAIAVARGIIERWPDSKILYIGTKGRTEEKAVPAAGFEIQFIQAAGLYTDPVRFASFLFCNAVGTLQSLRILSKFKPDGVIGSGGFVAAPVLMAARILNIPYIILEQNVIPGKVNRLMARHAKKVLATFKGARQHLPAHTVTTGNPVRREIVQCTRQEGMERLSLQSRDFNLVITGASQGAKSINDAVIASLPKWASMNWNILHLTGPKLFEDVQSKSTLLSESLAGEYRPMAYTEDMASLLAVADLIVARSGATTLSEIFVRGIPAILIPYPHHKDGHGIKNAQWAAQENAAVMIEDKNACDDLAGAVLGLYGDREKQNLMARASRELGEPEALDKILDHIEETFTPAQ